MKLVKAKFAADFDLRPMHALLEYDVFAGLEALGAGGLPVLALSATDDPLYNCHAAVLQRVRGRDRPRVPGRAPGAHPRRRRGVRRPRDRAVSCGKLTGSGGRVA